MALSDETRTKLLGVTTATLTTCLLKRGLRNQWLQDVHPLSPTQPRMVGEAYTLRRVSRAAGANSWTAGSETVAYHAQRGMKRIGDPTTGAMMRNDGRGLARDAQAVFVDP